MSYNDSDNYDTYDTPDIDEVLQQDDQKIKAVPVYVENVVRTEEMPTTTIYGNRILLEGSRAQKIANADPRRKRVELWTSTMSTPSIDFVCVGATQGQADSFSGAMIGSINAVTRFEFWDKGEIWVRPGNTAETSGTITGFGVSEDDIILSYVYEQWAR